LAVADTRAERAEGLMGVDDLAGLDGMLFVFEEPRVLTFTMRETLIPLDVWFIDESGSIIGAAEMVPCPAAPCPQYVSPGEALRAIETPEGVYDFPVGERVSG
jgi:uncharacterized protein